MATKLKTVEFAHQVLASMVDNTLTSMTPITVYLPDATGTFSSVIARVSAMGTATAQGNITTRRIQSRLGAAAYTNHANSNLYTGSAEDIFAFHEVDLTAHFTANWSGPSMSFDSQVLMDGTATGIAWTNISVTLIVTYEYDDTAATQIKTVRIPLNAPTTALATTKPGTATATIPNLSTRLPEASKTFRSTFVTVQGNVQRAGTADVTFTMQLDTTTAHTTGVFEGVGNTDYFYRYVWDCSAVLNTSASMGFYLWGSTTDFDHAQAWLTVTYEFAPASTTRMTHSLMLPMELTSPMGGTTSADYQRGVRELFIAEPGTIDTEEVAFFAFWDQAAAISGLNMRVGTGAFTSYSDVAATLAGSNAAMCRDDTVFALARGRNELNFDVYRSDAADLGWNLSGFWIVNYTSDVPAQGVGAANHTVIWNMGAYFDGAANILRTIPAMSIDIPAGSWFMTALGTQYQYVSNTTGNPAGVTVLAERLAGEGGLIWEPAYVDVGHTDPETGLRCCYSQVRSLFQRWPGDPDPDRIDITTARRWRTVLGNACNSFDHLSLIFTYHSITFAVGGTISGSDGGTVTIDVKRQATGELVASTTRSGDGAYSVTWYDDTEPLEVTAYDATGNLATARDVLAA